jgi:hypothetical protein
MRRAPFWNVACAPSVSITLRALGAGRQRFSVEK